MISGLKRKLQLCGALIGIVLLLCAAVPLSAAGDDTAAWYADCRLPVAGCVQVHTYLHVRNGPSVRHEIIDALTNGTEVSVQFITGEWGKVDYGAESTGWVCLRYVAPSGGDAAYPAVQIRTADYKQYDRRWASLEVGRSGKTVRQIGCTLTCAAMTESLRLERSVTPAEIVRCSAFTPGGAYYWPDCYVRDMGKESLEKIYALLCEGKPVIFEAKNTRGVSHWVLIVGWSGGDTLEESGFLIHDPASETRVTLSDYRSLYPVYSKIVYYE